MTLLTPRSGNLLFLLLSVDPCRVQSRLSDEIITAGTFNLTFNISKLIFPPC